MKDLTIKAFLDNLSSESPAPGGGAVAALGAALGSSLTSMVANLTIGKKKYQDVQGEMEKILLESNDITNCFLNLMDLDAQGFLKYMDALKLPKDTPEDEAIRSAEIQKGAKGAAEIPMEIAKTALKMMELAKKAAFLGNKNTITDAGVAALLGESMISAAVINAKINLSVIHDNDFVINMREECRQVELQAHYLKNEIMDKVYMEL